ncbi:MAG: putative sulfate/molybdate transporter, partial [bacterium]
MNSPSLMSLDTDSARAGRRIRFDRNELAGAFGDIGTDLPLLIGMILASGIDVASTIIVFGLLQVLSGLVYRIPMPIQPLKAVAALVITQKIAGPVIYGAGLAVGLIMLALTLSGLLGLLGRLIPKPVVRGIQLGLGVKLSLLALGNYVVADGVIGYVLAAVAFVIVLCLLGNRRYPPALIVIALGIVYALAFKWDTGAWVSGFGFALP